MKVKAEKIKKIVRNGYAKALSQNISCCSTSSCCCGTDQAKNISKKVGYSDSEMNAVPEGANLGFGCGNPVAIASLKEGDVVLDLGSGAGFDAFLAAKRVGEKGRVIGVDMTPEMIAKAKENAKKGKCSNVEFRLGEIEKLPIEDNSVDVIISNCVINLLPEKQKVFKEAFRVLKHGGRLMVSDLVLIKSLPENVRESAKAYVGCIAGAVTKEDYLGYIGKAGFRDIKIVSEAGYPGEDSVVSVSIHAVKP